jgi:DNA-binding GntR family transcriptional regulator
MVYFYLSLQTARNLTLQTSMTLITAMYDRLREDLLKGFWPPGKKLGIRALTSHYETGATPVREALNRLSAEGLVKHHNQRGFEASPVSDTGLRELAQTRIWVETLALQKSMQRTTAQWEETLVLSLHRLKKTPRSLSRDHYLENPEWEQHHRGLHMALIGNCGSHWLVNFCEQLYDQAYRYRQLAVSVVYKSRDEGAEHKAIVDAVLASNVQVACEALTGHYNKTTQIILDSGSDVTAEWKCPAN